jgi:hypothetical protein
VAVKEYLAPFAAAFVASALAFLAIDYAVMRMMGLALVYQP